MAERVITYSEALNEAHRLEMASNPDVVSSGRTSPAAGGM